LGAGEAATCIGPESCSYNVVAFEGNCNGLLEEVDRDYELAIFVLPNENPFNTFERTATYSHSLPFFEKRV
jgi:hypothetical protein